MCECRIKFLGVLLVFCGLTSSSSILGQEGSPRSIFLNLGQYPASIAKPNFSVIHPGIQLGLVQFYNKSEIHKIYQNFGAGFLHHKDVQNVGMLTTEIGYRYLSKSGLVLTPFAIGGGYAYSVLDQETFIWNEAEQKYVQDKWPSEHNWLITLGASLGWKFGRNDHYTIFIDYRIQVQGVFVNNTVPVIVYSPIKIGLELPFSFHK